MTSSVVDCKKLAEKIHARGLEAPAVFFLELYKPLAVVYSAGASFFSPILKLIFGLELTEEYIEFFQSRENIEKLIVAIEEESK